MSDQQITNLAFELMTTNQTLQVFGTVLYELLPAENDSMRELLAEELRSLQIRIERLHALTRPPKR